jgi:hypothetical protein
MGGGRTARRAPAGDGTAGTGAAMTGGSGTGVGIASGADGPGAAKAASGVTDLGVEGWGGAAGADTAAPVEGDVATTGSECSRIASITPAATAAIASTLPSASAATRRLRLFPSPGCGVARARLPRLPRPVVGCLNHGSLDASFPPPPEGGRPSVIVSRVLTPSAIGPLRPNGAMLSATSATLAKRSETSRSKQRWIACSSSPGMSGLRSVSGGTGSCMIAEICSPSVSRTNGGDPANSS